MEDQAREALLANAVDAFKNAETFMHASHVASEKYVAAMKALLDWDREHVDLMADRDYRAWLARGDQRLRDEMDALEGSL